MTFAIGGSAKVRRVVREARTKSWGCECTMRWVNIGYGPRTDADGNLARNARSRPNCFVHQNPASLTRCPDCGTKRP